MPIIETDDCTGCGVCIGACPGGAIGTVRATPLPVSEPMETRPC